MRFVELARVYERLEATSKRLEMRAILVELIRPIRPPDLAKVLYLSQGMLRPEYRGRRAWGRRFARPAGGGDRDSD